MGSLFSGPDVPDIPPPPAPAPVPTIDNARASRQAQDAATARRGRAASILTSPAGDASTPNTGSKVLLGS